MEFQTAFTLGLLIGENHVDNRSEKKPVYQTTIAKRVSIQLDVYENLVFDIGCAIGIIRRMPKMILQNLTQL